MKLWCKVYVYETIFLKSWNSSSMLWCHHCNIGSKRLKSVYHVKLVAKILKSETIITLVQRFFSDGKISEFWIIDSPCDTIIPKRELSGQNLHLRYVFQLLEIAEGFGHWFSWLLYRTSVFKDTCFYRISLVAFYKRAYNNRTELPNFAKIFERRGAQSQWHIEI